MLRRFWFKFSPMPFNALNVGCGVTARDKNDAIKLVRELVFADQHMPGILEIIEDVDVSALDSKHVRPNMGTCSGRGIWYPVGFRKPD